MRTSLWTAVLSAIVSAGLGAGTAIGQEVVKAGYYLPGGTPCEPDGSSMRPGGYVGYRYHWRCVPPIKGNHSAMYRSTFKPWHGAFYDPSYGAPVALVAPPTAERQTNYGWGVGNTRVSRIDAQFLHPYPGVAAAGRFGFAPTPPWPSDTNQFGVYYVRGPW